MEYADDITVSHFGRNTHKGFSVYKPRKPELIAFIQLRVEITQYHNNRPVYKKVDNLSKDELIDECLAHIHLPLQPRLYKPPSVPIPTPHTVP